MGVLPNNFVYASGGCRDLLTDIGSPEDEGGDDDEGKGGKGKHHHHPTGSATTAGMNYLLVGSAFLAQYALGGAAWGHAN